MSFVKWSLFRGHLLHQVTAGPGHLEYLEYLEQGVGILYLLEIPRTKVVEDFFETQV